MKRHVRGAFGDVKQADCVIGLDYGTQAGDFWGIVNEKSAAFIASHGLLRIKPLLLGNDIARPLQSKFRGPEPDLIFEDVEPKIASASLRQRTKAELQIAHAYMQDHGLETALLVGQQQHVGYAALRAERLGPNVIVPSGLPTEYEPGSIQFATQGPAVWTAYRLADAALLCLTGNL